MKILIIGASKSIGKQFLEMALNDGHDVVDFILKQLITPSHLGKTPLLTY